MFSIDHYDYFLPEHLIAQTPLDRRDRSRLLVLNRSTGAVCHRRFDDLIDQLTAGDVLVVNDTEVVPARLHGKKETGGKVEVLVLDYSDQAADTEFAMTCRCLLRASKPSKSGARFTFSQGMNAEVLESLGEGLYRLRFSGAETMAALLGRIGEMPLPPYIRRGGAIAGGCNDRQAYQTVYAVRKGAVAAPTAGLHFTPSLLERIGRLGVTLVKITLHVGYGTFLPVRVTDIRDHRMHTESYELSPDAAETINRARAEGRRVVAVGTTSVRTLEYAADGNGHLAAGRGACDLFIYPGFRFKVVDAMVTNFHLPQSTLLMLVSAFAGRENILAAYSEAVSEAYRFFSYGDAMMIV